MVKEKQQTGKKTFPSMTGMSESASLSRSTRSTTARVVQSAPATHNPSPISTTVSDKTLFDNVWFEIFSPTMFYSFQNTIFKIIEMIITNQTEEDDFIIEWTQLTMRHGINGKTSLSKIKRCAKLDDLKVYIAFLQRCPVLDKYIVIRPSATNVNCFEFGLLQDPEEPDISKSYHLMFLLDPSKLELFDIKPLITLLHRFIHEYIIAFPNHKRSIIYREWLDSDFLDITSVSELIDITETKTLRQLIKLLQSAVFLKNKLLIRWTNEFVEFHLHNTCDLDKSVQCITRDYNYVQTQNQLQELHTKIYQILYDWSHTNTDVKAAQRWKNSLDQGNTCHATWELISKSLLIKSYQEYYNIISACSILVQQHLYLYLVENEYIGYCEYHSTGPNDTDTDEKESIDIDNDMDDTVSHNDEDHVSECVSASIKDTPLISNVNHTLHPSILHNVKLHLPSQLSKDTDKSDRLT